MELHQINHYKILGLPCGIEGTTLSEKEISKAFRIKALELHPDKQPNDPDASKNFQILKSSYEILRDENSRKLFDAQLIDTYTKMPKETSKQGSMKKMWFTVSWKVGDGFGDYSDNRLKKLCAFLGVVEDVIPVLKQIDDTTKSVLISIIVPSSSTVFYNSVVQMLALGDPSNPMQIRPTLAS